ncbi:TetR/AcrR family transcriptional regulator [Calothrix sp. PCC 6303]|uniref:TetR/AcrR family transcriptional regulator n=1 Tax=Calothrix sp. PCC 6303 TaxID=1170562 RepID=UPI0002A03814|nr:TetR/AcrR family transcriptional regulator [Calothrix sp. PCC 6303]AFZ02457.1 transcriptional regulator, TetR family [Calothrix sp. PCC 6303]
MSSQLSPARQRIIKTALELFTTQGVTSTTTRQIADLAEVNEVTLFRQFGNKYGLLLALLEESTAFQNLGEYLAKNLYNEGDVSQIIHDYASNALLSLEQVPELMRSLIGEASQYPTENRQVLGRGIKKINQQLGDYLAKAVTQGSLNTNLPPHKLAALLNATIFGYAIIEFTSEFTELWQNQDDFINSLINLFVTQNNLSTPAFSMNTANLELSSEVVDLPGNLVFKILQQARKSGLQDYALAYVLFAAGLSVNEIISLQKTQQIQTPQAHILQISTPTSSRQVPLNQWIMGKHYGVYNNNPLAKWLKSRKDDYPTMFINDKGSSISELEIQQRWQKWTDNMYTPQSRKPTIIQTQHTWRVEMLMRGISIENLTILTGCTDKQLQPYAYRAKEKSAIEQATNLDQKN